MLRRVRNRCDASSRSMRRGAPRRPHPQSYCSSKSYSWDSRPTTGDLSPARALWLRLAQRRRLFFANWSRSQARGRLVQCRSGNSNRGGCCRPLLVGKAPLVVGEVLEIGTGRQLAAFLRKDNAIQLSFLIRRSEARATHVGRVDRPAGARGFGEPLNRTTRLRRDVTFFRHDEDGLLVATKVRAWCPCPPEALRDAQVPDAVRDRGTRQNH